MTREAVTRCSLSFCNCFVWMCWLLTVMFNFSKVTLIYCHKALLDCFLWIPLPGDWRKSLQHYLFWVEEINSAMTGHTDLFWQFCFLMLLYHFLPRQVSAGQFCWQVFVFSCQLLQTMFVCLLSCNLVYKHATILENSCRCHKTSRINRQCHSVHCDVWSKVCCVWWDWPQTWFQCLWFLFFSTLCSMIQPWIWLACFRISAPKIWNLLPASIRNSPSLPTFRWHLKTHYFQSLTRKIVSEMTYNCVEWDVKPYYTIPLFSVSLL